MRVGADSVKLRDMNREKIDLSRLMATNIQDNNDNGTPDNSILAVTEDFTETHPQFITLHSQFPFRNKQDILCQRDSIIFVMVVE